MENKYHIQIIEHIKYIGGIYMAEIYEINYAKV